MLRFPGQKQISNINELFFDKGNIYSEPAARNTDANTWGEYFLKIEINTEKSWLSITD